MVLVGVGEHEEKQNRHITPTHLICSIELYTTLVLSGAPARQRGGVLCTCNMMDNHREVLARNPLVVIVFAHTMHWLQAIHMSDPINNTFGCRSCAKSSGHSWTFPRAKHTRELSPSLLPRLGFTDRQGGNDNGRPSFQHQLMPIAFPFPITFYCRLAFFFVCCGNNKGYFTHETGSSWPLHFKHSHWWNRRSRPKFASHYAWGTDRVCECKMDVKPTWIPTWHWMDHCSWSLGLVPKNHLLDVGLNTKPGDHGTPNAHNRWFILL